MNILHVTHLYLPSVGGTEIHTRELSIELAKLGHQVSIFTTDAKYAYDLFPKIGRKNITVGEKVFRDSQIAVYRFHVTNSLFASFCLKSLGVTCESVQKLGLHRQDIFDWVKAWQKSPLVPKLYFKLLNSDDFDVVNSTPFPYGYSLFIKKICERKRIPFIITPRAHTMSWEYSQPFLLKTVRESDGIIALTEHEKDFFARKGVPKDKIFVTGIGVPTENHQTADSASFRRNHKISKDSKIILFIGRIDKGKGVGLLLRSMEIVWKKIPDVYLILLGRSTQDTSQIIYFTRHEKRIVNLPDATEKTKNDALASSDLFVLPSIWESFGGVFLEAWLAGKPVIGCRTPTISCVVDDGVDGLLSSCDEKELAEKMIYLLENEDKGQQMGKIGREKVLRNYTWKIIAAKTLKAYEVFSKK